MLVQTREASLLTSLHRVATFMTYGVAVSTHILDVEGTLSLLGTLKRVPACPLHGLYGWNAWGRPTYTPRYTLFSASHQYPRSCAKCVGLALGANSSSRQSNTASGRWLWPQLEQDETERQMARSLRAKMWRRNWQQSEAFCARAGEGADAHAMRW